MNNIKYTKHGWDKLSLTKKYIEYVDIIIDLHTYNSARKTINQNYNYNDSETNIFMQQNGFMNEQQLENKMKFKQALEQEIIELYNKINPMIFNTSATESLHTIHKYFDILETNNN